MDVVFSVVNYVYTSFLRLGGSRVYGDGNSGALVLERELREDKDPDLWMLEIGSCRKESCRMAYP